MGASFPLRARGLAPSDVPRTADPDVPPPPVVADDDGGGGPNRWVTIATFWASPQAHLARLRLESDGIPAVLLDEHVTSFCYTFAFGGIKLQVPADRAAEARRALDADHSDGDSTGDTAEQDDEALDAFVAAHAPSPDDLAAADDDMDDDGDDDGDARATCPACGDRSASAGYDRLIFAAVLLLPLLTLGAAGVPSYLVALAIAFAVIRSRVRVRCRECERVE